MTPESGMTESSENLAPAQTQTAPPPPSQGRQECARARPFDRENCSIKARPQKANGAPNEQEAAPKLDNAADKEVVEKKKKKKRAQFRPTPPESSNESESDTDSDYVLPSPKSPEKVKQRGKSRETSPKKIYPAPESSKQPKLTPTPEKPSEKLAGTSTEVTETSSQLMTISRIDYLKDEAVKEALTLAKKRLSDDMDISSGSDDSDPDRTISFVKGRPSTDQHKAVTENACQSVYNEPVLQSPMFQEKRHPPVLPRIPKKAPTAGVSQINDEGRASSSSVDSEKRQKPAERTESGNPISAPVLNDPIPTSSNEASKDPCAKPKEAPPPIPRPPIGKIPLLPPARPTINPAAAAPQPVPPPWGNLWSPIQPPRPIETASARGILDQILESQTSQSFFSPPETIESSRC
ncbi:hypothetical protein WR25_17774 [Diploscapter pachys]|uniref:Uncharacterized protein n=1 Tax=Diploscapter pachys TaxID=2018661 RepID=A0A2A2KL40_9BILA|nr:hypothetical protein WR25_17774 [Diploscapter pachys]